MPGIVHPASIKHCFASTLASKENTLSLPADLLNGGSPAIEESGLQGDELDLSDAEAVSDEAEDKDEGLLSDEEDESDTEDAQKHSVKPSRTKADTALLPTEDRYSYLSAKGATLCDTCM